MPARTVSLTEVPVLKFAYPDDPGRSDDGQPVPAADGPTTHADQAELEQQINEMLSEGCPNTG